MWPVPVISNAVTDMCKCEICEKMCSLLSRMETLGPLGAAVDGRRNYVAEVEGRWRRERQAVQLATIHPQLVDISSKISFTPK